MKDFQSINNWRTNFGLPVRQWLTVPSKKEAELALSLIGEEFNELKDDLDGYLNRGETLSFNAVADSIGDLYFVVTQMAAIFGFNPSELIQKVYDSNMSKLCPTKKDAELTIAAYAEKGIPAYYQLAPDQTSWVIRREADNKVLKSLQFKDPEWNYDQSISKLKINTI